MKKIAVMLSAIMALAVITVTPAVASTTVEDLYTKTVVEGNFRFSGDPGYTTFCHRTGNVGHWQLKTLKSDVANGHITGTAKNHKKPVIWQGIEVEDFIPTAWQIANQTCGPNKPPPPERPDYDPQANFIVCGDPRLLLDLDNDSDFAVTYTMSWKSGGAKVRREVDKTVAADGTRQIMRWVLGQSYFRLTAQPAAGVVYPAIYSFPEVILFSGRLPAATPWGVGECPSGLQDARNGW